MEANVAAMQVTPHTCNNPYGSYYSSCDQGGYAINTQHVGTKSYGVGGGFKIDTSKPFQVEMDFTSSSSIRGSNSGSLSQLTTVLSQSGGGSFSFSHTDSGRLSGMSDTLSKGMVLTLSMWGDGGGEMSWLDAPTCSTWTSCDPNSYMIISNFFVK